MSNKVDKLFKEKLGDHSLPPSAQAWEKIEANLSKKNKAIIWFRVAAVIALFGAFTFALIQWKGNVDEQESLATRKDSVVQAEKVIQPEIAEKAEKKEEVIIPSKDKTIKHNESKPSYKEERLETEFVPVIKQEENSIANVVEQKVMEEIKQLTTTPEVKSNATVASKKSMKLTFNLPTIEAKKEVKEQIMVADAAEEKKTTLQKAADVANDIRSGDVLGSLREAKDDLFAWEFRKDKSKKN